MTRQDEDSYRRGRSPFRPPARRPLPSWLVLVSERLRGYGGACSGGTPAGRGHRRRPGPARGHGLRGAGRADRRRRPLHPAPARGRLRKLVGITPEAEAPAHAGRRGPPGRRVPRPDRGRRGRVPGRAARPALAPTAVPPPAGPPTVKLPDADLGDGLALLPAALGIFFVSCSDEILTARSFAGRRGEHIRANTELGGDGRGQSGRRLHPGVPDRGQRARTAVNDQMGVRSQLSGLLAAGVIALVPLFLTAPWSTCPRRPLARSSWPPGSAS
jgi:Sulfate permease family